MLKNTGDPMDAPELAEKAKKQNIIDMAVGFAAMMPRLNGPVDTPILRHLFKKLEDIYKESFALRYLWTIETIGKEDYDLLQKIIRQGIRDCFEDTILPVQYDDIMGRRLHL